MADPTKDITGYDTSGNAFTIPQSTVSTPPVKTRQQTLQESLFSNPVSKTNIYEEEFKKAGLAGYKTQLEDLDGQIAKIRSKYTETEGKINENPWLSEASRVGRARILAEQQQSEIGNYLDQRSQLANLYNLGLNEVQLRAGMRADDANSERSLMEQELEFILNQNQTAQSRQDAALKFAAESRISSPYFSVGGTVYRTSDLKPYSNELEFVADGGNWNQVQDFSPQVERDTQIVTANGRSLLIDTQTGDVIRDLGSAYKGAGGGGTSASDQKKQDLSTTASNLQSVLGADGFVSPQDWKRAYNEWLANGYPGDDFVNYFKGYVNPADPQDYGVKY